MVWTVEIAESAAKEISKLDKSAQRRIQQLFREKIATNEDARRIGKPLKGQQSGLWRYRVGDYRLICRIQDQVLKVLVLKAGHRKDVYR